VRVRTTVATVVVASAALAGGLLFASPVAPARPAADGSFAIDGLPEGAYTVSAGFHFGHVSIPVKAQARTGEKNLVLDVTR